MQFSVCVSGLCGYHFEIIHTQSSSLFIFPALTCFLIAGGCYTGKDISNSFWDDFPFLFTSFSLYMQFSECVRRLCGYQFEIISTQSSTLLLLPVLTCFLMNMLPSSSPEVVIQVKTFQILSGMVALSRHSFFCLYAVLCVYQRFLWLSFWDHIHPIFHYLSPSGMNMFPHH